MSASSLDDQEIRSFIFQNDAEKDQLPDSNTLVSHGAVKRRIGIKSIIEKVNILKLNK